MFLRCSNWFHGLFGGLGLRRSRSPASSLELWNRDVTRPLVHATPCDYLGGLSPERRNVDWSNFIAAPQGCQ
jgi:hypothetical protein